jgi:beta-galactosidase
MKALAPHLQNLPLPEARVAMLVDYDSAWAIAGGRLAGNSVATAMGAFLFRHQIVADFIPPDRDLSPYRLLLIPALLHIGKPVAARLTQFIKDGGVIMAMGQLGMFDANANFLSVAGPEPLQDLFGFTMESGVRLNTERANIEIRSDQNVELPLSGVVDGRRLNGTARKWAGDVALKGGVALMQFDDSVFRGQHAVVERRTGKGLTLYAAANELDQRLLAAIMAYALKAAGVAAGPETPETVEVVERGPLTFAINHGPESAAVKLQRSGRALLGNYKDGQVSLAPYDVCVIKA